MFCGAMWAQPPAASGNPATAPPIANPGSPGINSTTYPGAGPLGTTPVEDMVLSDKAFVKKAAEETVTEVELGKLAQEKGSSDAVKQFGKRMVEDHARTSQDLSTAAAKVNVEVPSEMTRGGKKTHDKLAKLSGADFDRAYAKLMLNDQKNKVETFTQEARLGRVPEVKDFAVKTMPTLQEHRQMAEQLEASVKK
jgi:putative membrane protein